MRGESGVAGEGIVVGVPKFHSWGKCTMPLTNINSDWISNASSGLCMLFMLSIYVIYAGPLFHILGCNVVLYYNIGTGTSTAGQAVAGAVFQLTCPTWWYLCSSCVFLLPD